VDAPEADSRSTNSAGSGATVFWEGAMMRTAGASDLGKRSEHRYKLALEMKVYGIDLLGKPFIELIRAVNISRKGLHLSGLRAHNRVVEVIGIQNGGVKARSTVVWVGYPGSSLDGHIGVHLL
jgi:hypothetical protein